MAAFLDKVGAKINHAANDLTDKAKEVSEVTALKGQLRSQNKIMESMYLEIGKQYYELHKEDAEDVFAAQIQNITTAKQTADRIQDDIDIIKGNH